MVVHSSHVPSVIRLTLNTKTPTDPTTGTVPTYLFYSTTSEAARSNHQGRSFPCTLSFLFLGGFLSPSPFRLVTPI